MTFNLMDADGGGTIDGRALTPGPTLPAIRHLDTQLMRHHRCPRYDVNMSLALRRRGVEQCLPGDLSMPNNESPHHEAHLKGSVMLHNFAFFQSYHLEQWPINSCNTHDATTAPLSSLSWPGLYLAYAVLASFQPFHGAPCTQPVQQPWPHGSGCA